MINVRTDQLFSEMDVKIHTAHYISGDRWWIDRDGRNWWNRKTHFRFNAVYLTKVGSFDLRIGETLCHIPPKSLVFIPAGSDLEFLFDGNGALEKYYVHFDLSLGKRALGCYWSIPYVTAPTDFDALEKVFLALNEAVAKEGDPMTQIAARGHLLTLVSVLLREARAEFVYTAEWVDRDLREISAYMDEHFAENPTVKQLADRVGYSPAHFSKRFRSAFGATPSEYMNRRRIERACVLLRTTELSVSAIAEALGFYDSSYFSNFFRNKTGLSPNFYRKSEKGQ